MKVLSYLDSSCHLTDKIERSGLQTIVECRTSLNQILDCLRTSVPRTSEFSNLSNLNQA